MFYNSKHKEVNLGLAANYSINNSDVVIFPCVNNQSKMIESYMINSLKEDFVQGSFGIIEPINEKCKKINPRDIDLIFIPGIVFDLHGNRIGYGKGFYDKFLKSLDCLKVGVAYQSQIVDNLNFLISDFDIKMDYIITEKGMVNCKNE